MSNSQNNLPDNSQKENSSIQSQPTDVRMPIEDKSRNDNPYAHLYGAFSEPSYNQPPQNYPYTTNQQPNQGYYNQPVVGGSSYPQQGNYASQSQYGYAPQQPYPGQNYPPQGYTNQTYPPPQTFPPPQNYFSQPIQSTQLQYYQPSQLPQAQPPKLETNQTQTTLENNPVPFQNPVSNTTPQTINPMALQQPIPPQTYPSYIPPQDPNVLGFNQSTMQKELKLIRTYNTLVFRNSDILPKNFRSEYRTFNVLYTTTYLLFFLYFGIKSQSIYSNPDFNKIAARNFAFKTLFGLLCLTTFYNLYGANISSRAFYATYKGMPLQQVEQEIEQLKADTPKLK